MSARKRQHLDDTHQEYNLYEKLLEELMNKEYWNLEAELKLEALTILINDFLQTSTVRYNIDIHSD